MQRMTRRLLMAGMAVALLSLAGVASAATKINEIRIDNPGNDSDEYFELIGTPGASLAGLTYLVIGDASAAPTCGYIECVVDLTGFSLGADGLLCLHNLNSAVPAVLSGYDGDVPLIFENTDNLTHMLVSGFTGALGDDIDADNNGVIDFRPWAASLDSLGLDKGTVPNCTTEEYLYSAVRIGPMSSATRTGVPWHVYRAGGTQAWTIGSDTLGVNDTPGVPNTAPLFVDITHSPCAPLTTQPATVTAVVRKNPSAAELHYTVNGGAETVLTMDVLGTAHDTVFFFTQIPAQATNGALVEYYCTAHNPETNTGPRRDYFVGTKAVADLRVNDVNGNNLYRGYSARVRGRVTAAYGTFSSVNTDYYVQDATGGINVFKFGPHTIHPALGDSVTVIGTLEQFNGRLELTAGSPCDTVLVTTHGSGSPPAPLSLSLCDLREQHEGRLVRVQNLLINPHADVTFGADSSYHTANCLTDSLEMFIDASTNIPGNPITSPHMEVVGIAGQFDTSLPFTWWYQVQPRSLSDITFLSMTSAPAPVVESDAALWAPNPLGRVNEIRYRVPGAPGQATQPVRLAFYDLRGRMIATLVNGPVTPGVHTVTVDRDALGANGSGVVFCRYEVGGQVIARKLVMMH